MSGHSKWAQIKHQKGVTDQKRGKLFSKLLSAISIAARTEPNPQFNPRLRTAIAKAREAQVPAENIDRAVKRASETGQNLEELVMEAYGPGGVALLIESTTDNKNRTVSEIKKILNEHEGKWAEPGSVRWVFEPSGEDGGSRAKFEQPLPDADKKRLEVLLQHLEAHDDVQQIFTNASLSS